MKYSKVFLILLELTRNTGNLKEYFRNETKNLYLYIFPASFLEKPSTLFVYQDGKLHYKKDFFWYKGKNKILKIIFYYIYFAYITLFILPRNTIAITYQSLFCIGNSLFSLVKGMIVIFCVGDYFPIRKDVITKFYHVLTSYYATHLKYVLFPSFKFREIYTQNKMKSGYHRDMILYGIKKTKNERNPKKNLLGYLGNLREGQGLELIFTLLHKDKELKLEIIGQGSYMDVLKEQVKKLRIDNQVLFHGFVDNEILPNILSRWEIGLAPYDPSPLNMTYYAEPSKVKLYLQHHIPVIMTNITYLAKDIVELKAGECIEYNSESLYKAIRTMQKNYTPYQKGVEKLIDKYEYRRYYDKQFSFIRTINNAK